MEKGYIVNNFEQVLEKYKPMISACLRRLNIYKNHDAFKQAGFIALWRAWIKYDSSKGDFTPFANRTIYGAMLDELKKENLIEERFQLLEHDRLSNLIDHDQLLHIENEQLATVLKRLPSHEIELLLWIYVEEVSLQQAAIKAGISLSGIKKRKERSLKKLRKEMSN